MENNKASYKLKGLPPVYVINLDGEPHRWKEAENMLKYWEVKDYTRISAYDGREDDLGDILKGRYPDAMTSGEVGCTTSHLKAMKEFLKTDAPCAIMMEDDCDISTAFHWGFTWKDFYAKIPYDYDVIQLAIINPATVYAQLHRRFINDFSTACYVITRHHAEKLLKLHVRGEKYKLDNGVKPRPVADDLIYNSGASYACPIFLYKIELGSSIHEEHIEIFHRGSHDGLRELWNTRGGDITIDMLSDFDPYLGRIAGGDPRNKGQGA